MISRIFGSFKLVCAKKIEAGDDPADPVPAFKSKKQQWRRPIGRRIGYKRSSGGAAHPRDARV
jgi:hypothetical protein